MKIQVREIPTATGKIYYIDKSQTISLITKAESDFEARERLGNILRINALGMIQAAGSGHPGTSLSVMDILLGAHFKKINNELLGKKSLLFSSKGHDAPAIYSLLIATSKLSEDFFLKLRQINGLPGHPDIRIPGIPTNTGSLGMGISKAKGFIEAGRITNKKVFPFVILGDGELQEGQIWESMIGAAEKKMYEMTVIVDSNKIQSDTWVSETSEIGNLRGRVEGSGWKFLECDGHSAISIENALEFETEKPKWIQANTQKGFGADLISNFPNDGKFYHFHSGALSREHYEIAIKQLIRRVESIPYINNKRIVENSSEIQERNKINFKIPKNRNRNLPEIWSELLLEFGKINTNIIVLDADLAFDTGTYKFAERHTERYLQTGIAEQDMVSMAGSIALSGLLPIVHSFASFLVGRAFEQIQNNGSERTKIIYVGSLAGVLPAGPGHSHQAVFDVQSMATVPNLIIYEPSSEEELRIILNHAVNLNSRSSYIRIGNTQLTEHEPISKPDFGIFTQWLNGESYCIITSSPAFLEVAMSAARFFQTRKQSISVYSSMVLNSLQESEIKRIDLKYKKILFLHNFRSSSIFSEKFGEILSDKIVVIDVPEIPECGKDSDALEKMGITDEKIYNILSQN